MILFEKKNTTHCEHEMFATNSNFLIPLSLQFDVVEL